MSKKNEIIIFSESNIQKIEKLEAFLEKLDYEVISSDDFTDSYLKLLDFSKEMTDFKKTVDNKLKEILEQEYIATGNQSLENTECKITFIPGGMRETFNVTKFREEHPDLYEQYLEISNTSPSLRTTKKK